MGARILIVDDEQAVRESLSRALTSEHYETETAANGEEALARYRDAPVDLVVLDLSMPVWSGWDAFEELSRLNPLLQFVVITGRANQHFTALAAGVGALLEKPLDLPVLLETIRNLLAEPEETRLRRLIGRGPHPVFAKAKPGHVY